MKPKGFKEIIDYKNNLLNRNSWNLKRNWPLYIMLVLPITLLIIFNYIPMYGIIIAFQDFSPIHGFTGSPFVGLKWFKYVLSMPDFKSIVNNTFVIAICKTVFGQVAAIIFALLLNEIKNVIFKRSIQTMVYLPHFLSWVIIGGIFIDILATDGILNTFLQQLGLKPIFFLGSNKWFRFSLITTDIWKGFGWGAIIYLAALAGINPNLYEAAYIDGASKIQQVWHITLPGIRSTIILLATLSLGNVLNAGFEQVLMLYNPAVYETGDIISTFVYRMGLQKAQFSLSAAVGLFKSVVSFILIALSYSLAYKYGDYKIF